MIEYWHWHTLPVRHRDLLGRRAAAQPRARSRLRELVGGRRRPRAPSATSWTDTSPMRTSRSSGRPTAGSRWSSARRPRRRRRTRIARPTCASSTRSTAESSTRARRRGSCTPVRRASSARSARGAVPGARRPGLYVATDADLDLLRDYAAAGGHLVIGIRTGLRRRRGPRPRRGRARPAARCGRRALRGVLQPRTTSVAGRRGRGRSHRSAARDALGRRPDRRRRRRARPLPASAVRRFPGGHDATRTATGGSPSSARVPSPALAADLVRWAVPRTDRRRARGATSRSPSRSRRAPSPTAAARGSSSTGADDERDHRSPRRHRPGHRRDATPADTELSLAAWSTLTLIDE